MCGEVETEIESIEQISRHRRFTQKIRADVR